MCSLDPNHHFSQALAALRPSSSQNVHQPQQEQKTQPTQNSKSAEEKVKSVFSMFQHNATNDTNQALLGTLQDTLLDSLKN